MAVDEAIAQARIEGKAPNTVRLYRWLPSAVSVGRFQNIYNEVDLEACRIHGVDVVRRTSGGGSVYHDSEGEITYCVIVKREDLTEDVAEAYRRVCKGLIEAARLLGVNAEFNEGNIKQCPNVTVNERKLSGSAQAHKRGVVLQHGTLLLEADLQKMFTFLKVPWADACVDVVSIAGKKITSLAEELGRSVQVEEASEAMIRGFEKAFGTTLVEGELSDYEQRLVEALEKEKFSTQKWNLEGRTLKS